MFAFDVYTHLRWDILAPRGALHHHVPSADEVRLKPAVSWLLAGLTSRSQRSTTEHASGPAGSRPT